VRVLLNLTAASFAHPTKDLGAQSHPRRLPGQETCSLHPAALSRAGSEGVVFVRFFVANPLFGAFFSFSCSVLIIWSFISRMFAGLSRC